MLFDIQVILYTKEMLTGRRAEVESKILLRIAEMAVMQNERDIIYLHFGES